MTPRKKSSASVEVPRWLRLQEQIDFLYFQLGQHFENLPRSPLEEMIDEATQLAQARNRDIHRIARQMKKLKAEWSKETGQPANTEMEDQILGLPFPTRGGRAGGGAPPSGTARCPASRSSPPPRSPPTGA